MGQWLEPAKALVEREAAALANRPVWLFSSGPIGDPPFPKEEPAGAAPIMAITHAREHRILAGGSTGTASGLGENLVTKALRTPDGDYRPWDEVRAWAAGIAAALEQG